MHSTFELFEILQKPVCAVCELSSGAAQGYLKGVLSDGVNDPRLRDDWRRRGGLCERHWRVWRGLESPALSSAVLAQDLLGSYLDRGLPKMLRCCACELEREAEGRFLRALAALPEVRVREALEAGRGFLCLRHLGALEGALHETLRRRLEGLLDELAEFIRKSDYRFAGEPKGAERDSWLRAIRALGGEV